MTKIKDSGFANELHKILCSPFFVYGIMIISVLMAVLKVVVPAFLLLACLISVVLITQRDIKPIIPLILNAILSIPEHLSFGGLTKFEKVVTVISLFILFVAIVWFFVSTFAVEKKKFVLGKLFWGLVAVAVVGAGFAGLLCAEYEHIYSVRFLGIVSAITLIYIVLINGTDESVKDYTMHAFVSFGVGACLLIINYYANVDDLVLAFHNKSLRVGFAITNIIAAAIGTCIPASIYLATKKFPQIFIPLAVIMYVAILFTFSRAAILVTTVVLPIALIYGFLVSKKKLHYGLTFGGTAVVILVLVLVLKDKLPIWFEHTKELGLSDNGRLKLWKYGWEDFKRNKIFGSGFYGEDGADLVGPLKKYHSTIIQILACSGIVGVIGFGFHYYQRYKLMFKKLSIYKMFWLFALAVYEGCALIDIGQIMFFSQIMLALLFATCEKETEKTLEPAFVGVFKGGKMKNQAKTNLNIEKSSKSVDNFSRIKNEVSEMDCGDGLKTFSGAKNSKSEKNKVKAETNKQVESLVRKIENINNNLLDMSEEMTDLSEENAEDTKIKADIENSQSQNEKTETLGAKNKASENLSQGDGLEGLKNLNAKISAEMETEDGLNAEENRLNASTNIQTQELSDKELTKKHKFYRYFLKRFFDITLSLIAMIILSPVYLIVSILVRIKLGKPVIFKQLRPGYKNKIFMFYKYRSMLNATDKNGELLPDSERMTKFGKLLRKTSLDELPQLWNIFKGDMSFVGPRPKLVKDMVFYNENQNKRSLVRPGLTGYAQANGRNLNSWQETFDYDLYYVKNCSLWLDIKILFKTALKVIKKDEILTQDQVSDAYYFGDQLLNTNQITQEEYTKKLSEAKELERKIMEK